jgi:hypothetical protein
MARPQEVLLEEFREAGHMNRLHVSLMFAQITVFLGSTGALLFAVTSDLTDLATRITAGFGLVVCLVFLVHHERVYAYSESARSTAAAAQSELGLTLYRYSPSRLTWLKMTANSASRLLYFSAAFIWLLVVFGGNGLLH